MTVASQQIPSSGAAVNVQEATRGWVVMYSWHLIVKCRVEGRLSGGARMERVFCCGRAAREPFINIFRWVVRVPALGVQQLRDERRGCVCGGLVVAVSDVGSRLCIMQPQLACAAASSRVHSTKVPLARAPCASPGLAFSRFGFWRTPHAPHAMAR